MPLWTPKHELIKPTRRELIKGLAATLAAPAILKGLAAEEAVAQSLTTMAVGTTGSAVSTNNIIADPNGNSAKNGNNGSSGSPVTLSGVSTTNSNDVILLASEQNGGDATGAASGGGLTWNLISRSPNNNTSFWYAIAASPLSSVSFTWTGGGAYAYLEMSCFALSNVNTSSILDANGSLPAISNTNVSPAFSTSNAFDAIIVESRGSAGVAAGYTTGVAGSFLACGFKNVSVTQSGVTYTDPDAGANGMVVHAVQST